MRQELSSGIRLEATFDRLRTALAEFADEPAMPIDYVRAAQVFNECRRAGIQGSTTDFLICAIAERLGAHILTTGRDFRHYGHHLRLEVDYP